MGASDPDLVYSALRHLKNRNETLFFHVVADHLKELLGLGQELVLRQAGVSVLVGVLFQYVEEPRFYTSPAERVEPDARGNPVGSQKPDPLDRLDERVGILADPGLRADVWEAAVSGWSCEEKEDAWV